MSNELSVSRIACETLMLAAFYEIGKFGSSSVPLAPGALEKAILHFAYPRGEL